MMIDMQRYGTSHGQGVKIPGRTIWPLKFVTELYKLANASLPSSSSLRLHTRTPVTSISPISPSSSSSNSSSSPPPRPRRWLLSTPRGPISCTTVLHATNAYASHLLPQFSGPEGIVPTRGQVIAVRSNATSLELGREGWVGNRGFEYWFPRPVREGRCPLLFPLLIHFFLFLELRTDDPRHDMTYNPRRKPQPTRHPRRRPRTYNRTRTRRRRPKVRILSSGRFENG